MFLKKVFPLLLAAMLAGSVCGVSTRQSSDEQNKYCADEYDGSSYQQTVTESVTYTSKDDTEYSISAGIPHYSDTTGLQNICAVLCGATVMGFYDRLHDNLIPDFTAARIIKDKVIYTNSSPKIQELIATLYGLMGSSSTGTTLAGFKSGLSAYVTSNGSTIAYNDVGSSFAAIQVHISAQNLVALFMDGKFNFIPFSGVVSENNKDTFSKELYNGYHVSTVYGYRVISYYNGNSLIQTKRFFKVGTGHTSAPLAYVEYDNTMVVGGALGITII